MNLGRSRGSETHCLPPLFSYVFASFLSGFLHGVARMAACSSRPHLYSYGIQGKEILFSNGPRKVLRRVPTDCAWYMVPFLNQSW